VSDLFPINKINQPGQPLTMSSIEIARHAEKRHDNVMADIRKLLVELYGEGGVLKFQDTYVNEQNGQTYPCYKLPRRESDLLAMGYSVEIRARVYDRWQELEAKAANPYADLLPKNYLEALKQLTCTLEENEALKIAKDEIEKDLKIAAPKAEALDRIACTDGTFNLTNAAKDLGLGPQKLIEWLATNQWIYKRPGTKNWVAYQEKITRGLLVHKTATGTRPDGTEWISDQVRVTGKGLAKLALEMSSKTKQ